MKKSTGRLVFEALQLTLGIALSAFSVACFALPYDMVVAGVTGFARAINHFTGLGISVIVLILNVALFLAGLIALGKKFAASVVYATFAFPFFLGLFQNIPQLQHLVNEPLLAAICAGIIDGVGLGLVIRLGFSTGGMDIPCIIANRKLGLKVAPVMYALDLLVFLSQITITDSNGIILGILYSLILAIVMDKILVMNEGGISIMIFSKTHSSQINEKLLELGYGTSLMPIKGGYIQDEYNAVYCITSSRHLMPIKRATHALDPHAFITVSTVSEIRGNGYTELFSDEQYVKKVQDRTPGIEIDQIEE